jgi:hypothetical protein
VLRNVWAILIIGKRDNSSSKDDVDFKKFYEEMNKKLLNYK